MNISLTPELEKYIQDKVSSGLYTSASEVIRESLRLLNTYDELHQKRLEQLNHAIDQGLVQLEQGQGIEADEVYRHLQNKFRS
jgi:antitoxin ParD1/3/4